MVTGSRRPEANARAQLRGTVAEGRVFPVVFQQSTAGTDGLQQGGGSVGAEDESGIGRSLLHHLQQDILIPLVQLAAVRDDVYLAPGLIGADVHILTQGAGAASTVSSFVLCIQHGDHVRVDALQYLAAVAAAQAGPVRPLADVGGGEKPGSGGQVTPARQDDRVAETDPPRRRGARCG